MDVKDGRNPAWPMNDGGIHPDPIHPFDYLHVGLFCDSYLLRPSSRQGVFFKGFWNVAKVTIRPENDLAKIGYILDMKVGGKKKTPFMFLATYWNLSLKSVDLEVIFPSKSD